MKKLFAALAAILVTGAVAFAAGLPLITGPIDPSNQLEHFNNLVQQLDGNKGYAPAQVVSLGSTGTVSGATPVTLNSQRGVASFTGVATLATGAVTTLTLTDSLVAANSQCFAQVQSGGAAGSGPYVSTATPTAGSLAFIIANGGTTATGATQTFAIAFDCM